MDIRICPECGILLDASKHNPELNFKFIECPACKTDNLEESYKQFRLSVNSSGDCYER